MRNLICRTFGHRPAFGWERFEGAGYFKVALREVDGIGRMHADLTCDCQRCGANYRVGRIHLPTDIQIRAADVHGDRAAREFAEHSHTREDRP